MVGGFIAGIYEEIHTKRYPTEGVTVEARVLRAWVTGVTPHIEYEFRDANGNRVSRETTLYPGREWDTAQTDRTIMVEYLQSAPDWNRPISGEDSGPQFGGNFLYLTGLGIMMFGSLAVFALLGYDFRSKDGVNTLMRHGRVIRTWGTKTNGSSK